MSRLSDLLHELRIREPELTRDLEKEVAALADRRAFGLNFERHVPEAVELPRRKIRKGDKVRILSDRGKNAPFDQAIWRVVGIDRREMKAEIELLIDRTSNGDTPQQNTKATAKIDNLIVIAEFNDPIYPGLVSTGKINRSESKPSHIVINSENFHALETLLFTHRGKIDCVYIDPPYNSGAKDWKYNNHYVEADDLYRHSKWLAFMERRLKLTKDLLKPDDSVLIVTIDEKEYLRLGLLLEQTFPEAKIQMVSSIIKPEGTNRTGEFSRTNEYIFFVMFGQAVVQATPNDMSGRKKPEGKKPIEWRNLRRRENTSVRSARPNQFYAIFVNKSDGSIHSVGDPLPLEARKEEVKAPKNCFACFPLKPDGTEMLWGVTPDSLRTLAKEGFARTRNHDRGPNKTAIQYLPTGTVKAIKNNEVEITERDEQGAVDGYFLDPKVMPKTTWNLESHNAQTSGTLVLKSLLPGRNFPFPKSLYAVEDCLRFFVQNKPNAKILDFFAGSGTTAHAVFRLNHQDGGHRQSISITNNEVALDEQNTLSEKLLRPGDEEWEKWGICEHVTKPRITASITGKTPDGEPISGTYKFVDEFPIAEGFEENAEFFSLTYEAPLRVASNREFKKIAPMLWMRAGSIGRRIDAVPKGWDVADVYGVIVNLDLCKSFLKAVRSQASVRVVFIITNEDRLFEAIVRKIPEHIESVRLYESYLRNFEIDSGRGFR